ncbi:hypothetical protein Slala02_51030 [Streptomyces lavendulae subsp. lavendulae]|nr:hypothetical protein Slala01_24390 [Streptomyces lavendulae subsp. lavendulae]GLX29283.1 hypothetical protein Slala02_51030 [Streptomyces lavendulae subsp. lavendulae]
MKQCEATFSGVQWCEVIRGTPDRGPACWGRTRTFRGQARADRIVLSSSEAACGP